MSEINRKIYLYRDTDHDLVDCLHHLFERAAELFDQGEECVRISVDVPQADEYGEMSVSTEEAEGE